ncbi:MAG: AtzE family amidohydrolase [Acidimicrobiales bacterium]
MTSGDGLSLAALVRGGARSAVAVASEALAAIEAGDGAVNSFTAVLAERALADAERVDAVVAAGGDPGPLAGVPFAVKNLFDVSGEVTIAGSVINRERAPSAQDAAAVCRLCRAGAVLTGSLNMDEYAFGFITENSHYGPCHNPHDPDRVCGGSSGGSAAAVAAGFVPFALGTDTNGSVRVPASLCGVFGLKPTYGRISRRGVYPLCPSLDTVGILGRSVRDLAAVYDVLQGPDAEDPAAATEAPEPVTPAIGGGAGGLRIALAGGYFAQGADQAALAAASAVAEALGAGQPIVIPESARARAAAAIVTACEAAEQHIGDLRRRPGDFDPMTRPRFLASALVPASAYVAAQRFRRWFQAEMRRVLSVVDVIVAPATPFPAPLIGQRQAEVNGQLRPTQTYLGCFTQPLSFVGLPVLCLPVAAAAVGGLPIGVQLAAAPFAEATLVRVGAELERRGICGVVTPA